MKKTALISSALFLLPALAFAQGQNLTPVRQLVRSVGDILNALIPILIVVALLVFFWGLIDYIRHPEFKKGKNIMIAGIIALFVMVSIWGIVRLVQSSLGVYDTGSIQPPSVPQQRL